MRKESHVLKMDVVQDFSANADYFINSSHDGVLKFWEAATSTLKNEYKPSSHLSTTCSCLSWNPDMSTSKIPKKKKKKKRKSSIGDGGTVADEITELNLVAIGTVSGKILLYSVAKGDLHSELTDGHCETVNSICWYPENNMIYSGSSDQYIVEWEITSGSVKHKWKADKGAVNSLCRCSSSHLLSAGRSIKLWNLETKQVVKTFTGHSTEVIRLIHLTDRSLDDGSIDGSYVLSAALNDRLINIWKIDESSNKNALASYAVPDEPVHMQVSQPTEQKPVVLLVVTKSGQALIYEHTLNGRLKKPLRPKVKIQIGTGEAEDDESRPIQILAAYLCDEVDKTLLLVHGSYLKPSFEKVSYSTSKPELNLVREDTMKITSLKKENSSVSKVKTPVVSKDVTMLAPGHMVPSLPTQDSAKRRKRKSSVGEMSIEERLNAISVDQPGTSDSTQPPKADSLAKLLTQGLQSSDSKIIGSVLQNRNETLIRNTVKKLPVQMIIPLMQQITKKMTGHAQSGSILILWVKMVLTIHTSYLMTFPDVIDMFSSLYQMMDSRVNMFGRLSRLKGKLDIMLAQVSAQTQGDEGESSTSQEALLQYMEESSDDDLDDIAIGPGGSDSEENWEDLSEDSDMEADADEDG